MPTASPRRGLLFLAWLVFAAAGAAADDGAAAAGRILTRESKYGVDETIERLEAQLRHADVPVFALFDHADNAEKAGLRLRPTKVLVFGNPKIGTRLMLDVQASALDLPLRVSVWQDERGRTWIGYHPMTLLAADYGIADGPTLESLAGFLAALTSRAAGADEP